MRGTRLTLPACRMGEELKPPAGVDDEGGNVAALTYKVRTYLQPTIETRDRTFSHKYRFPAPAAQIVWM